MRRWVPVFLAAIFLALPGLLQAQFTATCTTFTPFACLPGGLPHQLPQALQLPPDLIEVLPIDNGASYFSDAVRVVDCPKNEDLPFGLCHNLLFGGLALMSSHLQGFIQIRFAPAFNGISHFEVSHPSNLQGNDTVIEAPQFFSMPVTGNFILDPFTGLSGGDLNLNTGEVTNLHYRVFFNNTFYTALQNANPRLIGNPFDFPGGYGIAQAQFLQRPDGLLDFTFFGTTFSPLGGNILGEPVRFPLPLCGPLIQCDSIQAPGTSLHPTIRVSTVPLSDPPCVGNCPEIQPNTVQNFTDFSYSSTIGDDFTLNIPQLGGVGPGRSALQGRAHIQFGERTGDFMPYYVSSIPPEGLLAPAQPGTPIGFSLGMLGQSEILRFPLANYDVSSVLSADDPFNVGVGELNLRTGANVGRFVLRTLLVQSIALELARLNPGLAPLYLPFTGYEFFEKNVNGETVFRFNGEVSVPAAALVWPTPDLSTGFFPGPDSVFDVFYRIQAMHTTDPPRAVKSGSVSSLVSSIGDTFSYNYSVPCNPLQGDASFSYTNNNASKRSPNGGTFQMKNLVSVSCINSRTSQAAPGDYDTVTFTGFGTWSQDSQPHVATVQVSTSPDFPYFGVEIDAGTVSLANTKPAVRPLP